MKCPTCGAELIAGHLYADSGMYWLPGEEDCLLWRTRERVEKKGGVLLSFLGGASALTAHHCPVCRQMLVCYGGENPWAPGGGGGE